MSAKRSIDREEVTRLYAQIRNAAEVARVVGCSSRHVRTILDEANIQRKFNKVLNKEEIWEYWKETHNISSCCKRFNHCFQTVKSIINEFNTENLPVKRRDISMSMEEEKLAYYCGLIASDGCLKDRGYSKEVSLAFQDKDVRTLKDFARSVADPPINLQLRRAIDKKDKSINTLRDIYCAVAVLPELYSFLVGLGITPRKSLTLKVDLSSFSDTSKWYFLRGALDGDGCFKTHRNLGECSVDLVSGSVEYLEYLQTLFGGRVYKETRKIVREGSAPSYRLVFRSNRARMLCRLLPSKDYMFKRKTEKLAVIADMVALKPLKITRLEGSLCS